MKLNGRRKCPQIMNFASWFLVFDTHQKKCLHLLRSFLSFSFLSVWDMPDSLLLIPVKFVTQTLPVWKSLFFFLTVHLGFFWNFSFYFLKYYSSNGSDWMGFEVLLTSYFSSFWLRFNNSTVWVCQFHVNHRFLFDNLCFFWIVT
jgi:hypothetical protein